MEPACERPWFRTPPTWYLPAPPRWPDVAGWAYNPPHARAATEVSGRFRGRPGRRAPGIASLEEDAGAARLSGAQPALLSPRAPVRAAVGDPGRPARLAALEPVEAPAARRRRWILRAWWPTGSASDWTPRTSRSTSPRCRPDRRGARSRSGRAARDGGVRYGGEPLAGLDLPNFHDYSTWLTGQRELATRAQLRLLRALLRRLEDDPERALPHAFACVRIEPYDEEARAKLIALLVALGRPDQATQQHQLGLRLLKEAGAQSTGALARAMRARRGTSATHETRDARGRRQAHARPRTGAFRRARVVGEAPAFRSRRRS